MRVIMCGISLLIPALWYVVGILRTLSECCLDPRDRKWAMLPAQSQSWPTVPWRCEGGEPICLCNVVLFDGAYYRARC